MRPHSAGYQAGRASTDQRRNVTQQLWYALRFNQHHGVGKARCFRLIAPCRHQAPLPVDIP